MNTKTKIIALAFFTVTAGAFAFTRTANMPPSDLRDAVGEETAADQLMRKLGAGPLDPVAIPAAAPSPVPEPEIVFKPLSASREANIRIPSPQMTMLINLARYVYDNKPDGITKGALTRHEFDINGSKLTDGSFRLKSLRMVIADIIGVDVFKIELDGTMTMVGAAAKFDEKMKSRMEKEVSFWVDYETKRGRYPPNSIPEPDDDDDGGPGKYYQPGR